MSTRKSENYYHNPTYPNFLRICTDSFVLRKANEVEDAFLSATSGRPQHVADEVYLNWDISSGYFLKPGSTIVEFLPA